MGVTEAAAQELDPDGYWDDEGFREVLREQPPSAKLVAKVLAAESWLSHERIATETLLPRRTVSYALNRLEDVGLATSRRDLGDPRKKVYVLETPFDH